MFWRNFINSALGLALFPVFTLNCIQAQQRSPASGERDTATVNRILIKARSFYFNNPDSSIFYSKEALTLAGQLKFFSGAAQSLNILGEAYRFSGDYPSSLEMQLQALSQYRSIKHKPGEMATLGFIGFTYVELMEYRQGLFYLFEGKKISDQQFLPGSSNFLLSNIGNAYEKLNMPDSALYYQQAAYFSPGVEAVPPLKALIQRRLGAVYVQYKQYDSALIYYHLSLGNSKGTDTSANISLLYNRLADLHYRLADKDSALWYAQKAFSPENTFMQKQAMLEASLLLSTLFREKGLADSALHYLEINGQLKDELYGPGKYRQIQLLVLRQQQEQQKRIIQEQSFRSRIRTMALVALIAIFLIGALLLWRNNRQTAKAKIRIEKAYQDLKATQQQLIQSEKMASLGELTAGIAHEIQNPLNFVNNFSEVSKELLDEMKEALEKGDTEDAKDIMKDVIQNLEKINHHGKRADGIVKGMLQHSRSSSGQKEPTDINALCDEYLRLAYHGLRAKDKSFNAKFETHFDESIGNVNVIPQEMGRVILNLINNAFYAVSEKLRQTQPGNHYEPTVIVSTQKTATAVEIKISDNGTGIPQKVLDKVFQPFFTTKPTGQGTGLGLSLSYDIVKAHGGELKVKTREGEGTIFIISIPV